MGAHPGGLYTGDLPVDGLRRGLRLLGRGARGHREPTATTTWIQHWVLDVETQEQWLERLGQRARRGVAREGRPDSWHADEAAYPPDLDAPVNAWECAAVFGARHLAQRCRRRPTPTGCSRARAWRTSPPGWASRQARAAGSDVHLTAEIGLWGYDADAGRPVRAQPSQLPDRDDARRRVDRCSARSSVVAGTTTIGCLGGAQVDRFGNINSTMIPGGPFLVGSRRRQRRREPRGRVRRRRDAHASNAPPPSAATSRRRGRVRALVTDLGILEKPGWADGERGDEPPDARAHAHRRAGRRRFDRGSGAGGTRRVRLGHEGRREVLEIAPPTADESPHSAAGTRAAGSCRDDRADPPRGRAIRAGAPVPGWKELRRRVPPMLAGIVAIGIGIGCSVPRRSRALAVGRVPSGPRRPPGAVDRHRRDPGGCGRAARVDPTPPAAGPRHPREHVDDWPRRRRDARAAPRAAHARGTGSAPRRGTARLRDRRRPLHRRGARPGSAATAS